MSEQGMTTAETCYRHPSVATGVHCTRCGRAICPDCMIPAPVGHQCPTCVNEAREEFRRSGAGPIPVRASTGLDATRVLLGVIVAAFVLEVLFGGSGALSGPSARSLLRLGALQPYLIAGGEWWRLFTSMFLHAGLLHILFNGYALMMFGSMVERLFGTRRFLVLFVVTGLLAGVTTYAFGPLDSVGVGASGAIFGIFGAFIAYNLRRRSTVQGMASLRWAFTMLLLNAFLAFSFRAIDWRAHLGGLVAGVIAGYALEGVGEGAVRRWSSVIGICALLALGVALFVMRTSEIRALEIFKYYFNP